MDMRQSVTEPEAIFAEQSRAILAMRIAKIGASYTVHLVLNSQKSEVFISTTRYRKQPKEYMHLGRLIAFVESTFPSIKTLELTL